MAQEQYLVKNPDSVFLNLNPYDTSGRVDSFYYKKFTIARKLNDQKSLAKEFAEYAKRHIGITNQLDSAAKYLKIADSIAQANKLYGIYPRIHLYQSYLYSVLNKRDSADYYLNLSNYEMQTYYDQVENSASHYLYTLMGDLYRKENQFDSAQRIYQRAYQRSLNNGFNKYATDFLIRLGELAQTAQGDYNLAKKHYEEVIRLGELHNQGEWLAQGFQKIGELYLETGNYRSAHHNLSKSLLLHKQNGLPNIGVSAALAKALARLNKADSALYYLQDIKKINLVEYDLLRLNLAYAEVYSALADYSLALAYNKKAEQIASKSRDNGSVTAVLKQRIRVDSLRGDYSSAFLYLNRLKSWEDSLLNIAQQERLYKIREAYESEKKQREIERLSNKALLSEMQSRQNRNIWLSVVVIIILSSLIVFIWYQRRVIAQKVYALNTEMKFLRFQLDPHFIFNSLSSIQRFILENKSEKASDFIAKYARLMRQFLEYSRNDFIPLKDEKEVIENYLFLQMQRYKNQFDYSVSIDSGIENLMIPPMFAQPFIENAIEHGFKEIDYKGQLNISFKRQNEFVCLTISDNGRGYFPNKTVGEHKPMATQITLDRLNLLKKLYNPKINLNIRSLNQNFGTEVTILLPYK